jgi:hypothetical protein
MRRPKMGNIGRHFQRAAGLSKGWRFSSAAV